METAGGYFPVLEDIAKSLNAANMETGTCDSAMNVIKQHVNYVPFACVLAPSEDNATTKILAATTDSSTAFQKYTAPLDLDDRNWLEQLQQLREPTGIEINKTQWQAHPLWPKGDVHLLVYPVKDGNEFDIHGWLLMGICPSTQHDPLYQSFLYVTAHCVASALRSHAITAESRARANMAKNDLEKAIAAKDEVFAMLGHELRNPLSPIITALRLLRARGQSSPEQDIIERQVAHMLRLVDDLLDVSRITRGKIELRKRKTELIEVVMRAAEMASPLLEQKQHDLVIDVPKEGLTLNADPDRLSQVVANLLTNAAKYSDTNSEIRLYAYKEGERIRIHVIDEGMGISPEMQNRIFEIFVQQPQTLERNRGGLGLGLTIVRTLVKLHDGVVSVRSEGIGKGSEFIVDLPAAPSQIEFRDAAPKSTPPSQPVQSHKQKAQRVLIVDDNSDAATLLGEVLKVYGYTVQVAHDGPSALEVAAAFKPHIALLDIGLPVMDGYELGRRLRHLDRIGDAMKIIAVTGYGQPSDKARSEASGFDGHLVKPVDLDLLTQMLDAGAIEEARLSN